MRKMLIGGNRIIYTLYCAGWIANRKVSYDNHSSDGEGWLERKRLAGNLFETCKN